MIVVDTNVISELMRSVPSPVVVDWVRRQRQSELCTTAVTVAEIRYGLERLPSGRRKNDLLEAVGEIFRSFGDYVFPFDTAAAGHYARIVTYRNSAARPIDGFDGQIAAICRARGADLATRNVKDFQGTGIKIIDPWQDQEDSVRGLSNGLSRHPGRGRGGRKGTPRRRAAHGPCG